MYSIKAGTEWSIGQGVNGTGRRAKITGFYVLDPNGRSVNAFSGKDAEQKATDWAKFCNEKLLPQYFPHLVGKVAA